MKVLFTSADKNKSGKLDKYEIGGGLDCVVKNVKANACVWRVASTKEMGSEIGQPLIGSLQK